MSLIVSALSFQLNVSAATYTMSLNTRYSGKISSSSQVDYFNFMPSETGIYTVETFGSRQSLSATPKKEGYTIIDTKVHNVYVRYNGEVIPVKIIGTTYRDSLGCNLLEYNCVNEITGVSINYDDISFVS